MVESDRPHAPDRAFGRVLSRVAVGAVVLMLLLAAAAHEFELGERLGIAADPSDPRSVAAPEGLELPEAPAATQVVDELAGGRLAPAAVRRAVGQLTSARRLGPRVGVLVAALDGSQAYAEGPAIVVPASTLKLLTAAAALETLGPDHRFTTRVVWSAGRLTLVGGGDPLLARRPADEGYPEVADVASLARDTARQLQQQGRSRVRLQYDASLFAGPAASPYWEPDYLPDDVVSPITALWVDEGRERVDDAERSADPARDAAVAFAAELARRGIRVVGQPVPGAAPGTSTELASASSAALVEIVQHVLETSDNEAAEVLARHVAIAEGQPASFDGAADAVRTVLRRLGVGLGGAVIHDGSGLARSNRLRLQTLVDTLAVGASEPQLAGVVEGLPVAGFTGSLGYRFVEDADDGLGFVRAKTGTLTGVHGMAGLVVGSDGSLMLFAAVADRVRVPNTLFARDRLDELASALAGCSCSG